MPLWFHVVTLIAGLLIAAGVAYRIFKIFITSTGTILQRVLATSKSSMVIFWQLILIMGGAFTTMLASVADVFDMPEFKTAIQTYLKPEYSGLILIGFAVITIWARTRTLNQPAYAVTTPVTLPASSL